MIPHTFVLVPDLRIHAIYDGYWFWGRPTNEELRRDLREVARRVRPDWTSPAPACGNGEGWRPRGLVALRQGRRAGR